MKRIIVSLLAFLSISVAIVASNGKGIEFYKAGMYEAAKDIFLQQPASSTDDQVLAAYYLGLIYAQEQNVEAATAQFQKAIDLNPKSPFGYIGKGRLELANNVKAGESLLKQAEGMGKKNADVLVKVAEAYFANNMQAKAQAVLEKAKAADKTNVDIYLLEADVILAKGKDSETIGKAISKVEDADYYSPNNPLVLTKLAQLYRMVSGLNFAFAKVNDAIAADKDYLPAYVELGNVKYAQGQYKEAVAIYEKALATNVHVPFEWCENYAYALYFDKQYEKSLQEIEKNLLKKPNNVNLLRLQAYNMYELLQYEEGLAKMDAFFATVPEEKYIYLDFITVGRLQTKQAGKENAEKSIALYESAIENYNKAAVMETDNAEPYKEMALTYAAMKNFEEAVKNFEKYFAMTPKPLPSDLNTFGDMNKNAATMIFNNSKDVPTLQANQQNFNLYIEKSAKAFSDFIAIAPEFYLGYYNRAKVYELVDIYEYAMTNKNKGVALPYYNEAIAIMEKDNADGKFNKTIADLYNGTARYYLQNNDTKNTIEYFKKALAIDPANATAKEMLVQLKVK
ncbi:MAG: tetratricopeptide repeat protein [Bacteroidales bacterium]|jgi:tetratricopeptide (TPR) repeat protein|nr:tetratricopeptide repeat protein [Bacteroidales bacterium]